MGLDSWKTVADTFQAAITSVAVIVGALWTYFKFIKGRTFRPHVETRIDASWLDQGADAQLLHVRVQLKNIGQAKVEVDQDGTALLVSRMATRQVPPPAPTEWDDFDVAFEIFLAHEWIEPGEVVADELLVRLPAREDVIEIKTRIALTWKPADIVVQTRQVFVSTEVGSVSKSTGRPGNRETS